MLWPTGYEITVQKNVFLIQTLFRLKKFVSKYLSSSTPFNAGPILPDLRPTTAHHSRGSFVTRVIKHAQRRRRRQLKRQKSNRLRLAMNKISLFCTFLIRSCTTTTCNFLISRFKMCACSGIVALEFNRVAIYYSKGSFPCRRRCFKLPFILEIASGLISWRDLWASAVFFFLFWRLSRENFGNKPPRKYPLQPAIYAG